MTVVFLKKKKRKKKKKASGRRRSLIRLIDPTPTRPRWHVTASATSAKYRAASASPIQEHIEPVSKVMQGCACVPCACVLVCVCACVRVCRRGGFCFSMIHSITCLQENQNVPTPPASSFPSSSFPAMSFTVAVPHIRLSGVQCRAPQTPMYVSVCV